MDVSVPTSRMVSLEEASELIARREEKLRAQGKDPRAPKKKSTRKKKSG